VTEANQSLAQSTIASPIAGTVIAVNLAPGQSVSAGSSTANIVIQGAGGYEATTNISLTKIASVHVGQPATVTQDGSSTPVTGTVTSISAMPTSNTSSTTYGVVIGFDGPTPGLMNGAVGTVSITTGSTTSALAVPSSAVTTTGGLHTVTVLENGKPQSVVVQVGVVGTTWTSITRGLTAGQEVVLANVKEPLPGSATSVPTNGRGFGNGNPFLAQFANRRPG
jgi:RND family efflux transporter MFP subunit